MNSKKTLPADAWERGQAIALACAAFEQDVEEEWVAQEPVSCYNCRYRRFTAAGILCMKSRFPETQ